MAVSFQIGVIPNRPLQEFLGWVERADELGFEGVWVADSQSVFRDAYLALALFAANTHRMKLATGVTNPVTRHPAVLAGSFATLDEMSGGRAVLGIGVGESAVETLGLKAAKLARLEEIIRVIRTLMAGDTVNFEGRDIRVSWPPRKVPVVIAGSGPKSLQLAGRVADGVLFQVGAEPALVQWALRNIEIGARAAGRELSDVRLYQRLACAISPDRDAVREQLKGYAAVAAGTVYRTLPEQDMPPALWADLKEMKAKYDYYEHADSSAKHAELITDRILDAVAVTGPPEEVVPRFRALRELGVEGFVMPMTTRDPRSMIELMAAEVIPAVNA